MYTICYRFLTFDASMKRPLLLLICSLMGFLQFVKPLPRNATDYEGRYRFFNFNFEFYSIGPTLFSSDKNLILVLYFTFTFTIRRYVLLAEIWSRESSKDPSSSKQRESREKYYYFHRRRDGNFYDHGRPNLQRPNQG